MSRPHFKMALLHPRWWLTWVFFALFFMLVQLPHRVLMVCGSGLGYLMYCFAHRRRKIAECNLALCFPDMSQLERKSLLVGVMRSMGKAFFETGMAWFWSAERLRKLYSIKGLEHLQAAAERGEGVVFLTPHFVHVDLCSKLMGMEWPLDGFYKTHKNPVYDYLQRKGRERGTQQGRAIAGADLRVLIRSLREGRVVVYLPDQDFRAGQKVFVPFFGVQASTVTATSKLAKLGRATVLPFGFRRSPGGRGYELTVLPPLENFPSDDESDCRQINEVVERLISEAPSEYLWVHRRFKTRPEGEADLYAEFGVPPKKRKRRRKTGQ